jgi:tetratricopeptide (TPR) repeat protein
MRAYRAKEIERRFGVSAAVIRSLLRAKHIEPESSAGRLHYSFRDLIVLRTASALHAERVPVRAINRALKNIRRSIQDDGELSAQSLVLLGDSVALQEGSALRMVDSGQYALGFDTAGSRGSLLSRKKKPAQVSERKTAELHFARAYEIEHSEPETAIAEYRKALLSHPRLVEARINLGRLLHLQGRHKQAELTYRGDKDPTPLLLFNLAVLLDDLVRTEDAIALYRQALAGDPGLIDAHFNLARLYELAGEPRAALRHLLAYRRSRDA